MPAETDALKSPREDARHLKRSFLIAAAFTACLWLIKALESMLGVNLISHSIFPGDPGSFSGILWAPLIHSSFNHLFANTAPLLILGTVLLYGYPRSAKIVIPVVYLGTGLCVWLFARPAYHLGASGLTFGFMFFVFTVGVLRWDKRAIPISMIVFFLYGGMIWGVFPSEPDVSYESHLFGAIIGIVLAILLRHLDPLPPQKKYSWEEEEAAVDAAEEDPPGNNTQ